MLATFRTHHLSRKRIELPYACVIAEPLRAPRSLRLYRVKGFFGNDGVMRVLRVILWQLALVHKLFLCEMIFAVIPLQQKAAGVGGIL